MPDNLLTAQISETGESAFAVEIQVSGYGLKGDEPAASGGKGLAPAPYDYLATALGECTAMTVRWYALQQKWPLEHVAVKITYQKIPAANVPEAQGRSGRIDLFEKTVTIKGDALTLEQRQKLLDVAAKCPVQRTLEGNPVIRTLSA